MNVSPTIEEGFEHLQAGRLAEAEAILRAILARDPNQVDALHLLGVLADQTGHAVVAATLIGRAAALRPDVAEFRQHFGEVLLRLGRIDQALPELQQAIKLGAETPAAHNSIAKALHARNELPRAEGHYRRAIELDGRLIEAHANLGRVLHAQRRYDQAIAAYQRALELNAQDCPGDQRLSDAEQAGLLNHLAHTQKSEGLLDDAIASYRRAVALDPGNAAYHSDLCLMVNYHPEYGPARIVEEAKSYARRHADALRSLIVPYTYPRDPGRSPLRIGYVSSDFCMHSCARYILPLLRAHDPQAVSVVCYSNARQTDAVTDLMRRHAPQWRDIARLSDEQAAQLVREDRIDILVDLNLHTGENRLLLFARKPAPMQATWLGYPGTTGLETIDYRISDVHMDPPDRPDPFGIERVIPLPDCFWCFWAEDESPAVGPLPALASGYITFGSLNNPCKMNDRVLTMWARVMRGVDDSRLLLLAEPGGGRRRVTEFLRREGIEPERVEFVANQPRDRYLASYHRIDVGLDTFPYNGHITSLDSLWMGVPVVSLSGVAPASRAGRSFLMNLNLQELAAESEDQFVAVAKRLAGDVPALAALRGSLRSRMRASTLMDIQRFARNMEAAYRTMWEKL